MPPLRRCTNDPTMEQHPMYQKALKMFDDMPWLYQMFIYHGSAHDMDTFLGRICRDYDAIVDEHSIEAVYDILKWAYAQRDEEIRPIAYRLWQQHGCPDNSSLLFWHAAKTLIAEKKLVTGVAGFYSRRAMPWISGKK